MAEPLTRDQYTDTAGMRRERNIRRKGRLAVLAEVRQKGTKRAAEFLLTRPPSDLGDYTEGYYKAVEHMSVILDAMTKEAQSAE